MEEDSLLGKIKQKKNYLIVIAGAIIVIAVIIVIIVIVSKSNSKNNSSKEENIPSLCLDSKGKPSKICIGGWFYKNNVYNATYNAEWAKRHNWNYVFMSGTISSNRSKTRLLENYHNLTLKNISLHVMTLESTSLDSLTNVSDSLSKVETILNFCEENELDIAGIHIDIEPHAMPEWKNGTYDERNPIFELYLNILSEIKSLIKKYNQKNPKRRPVLFSAAVAWWYANRVKRGKLNHGRGFDLCNKDRLDLLVPMIYEIYDNNVTQIMVYANDYLTDNANVDIGLSVKYINETDIETVMKNVSSTIAKTKEFNDLFYGQCVFANSYYSDWGK